MSWYVVNYRRKVVYWSEGGTIKRANLDGSGVITLISGVLNLVGKCS